MGRTHAAAARLSDQRGQWNEALKRYRQALALEPDDEIALRLGILDCHLAKPPLLNPARESAIL